MMKFSITYEGKKTANQIQEDFKRHLSEAQITKLTAAALNETAKRAIGFIKKEVRKDYAINAKYLGRMARVTKRATASRAGLYAEVSFVPRPVPLIGFKHSGGLKRGSFVKVQIKKGKTSILKHAFIRTMSGTSKKGDHWEHEGIFFSGYYSGGNAVHDQSRTRSGKTRITEMLSTSPYSMATSKGLEGRISSYIESNLPKRLRGRLQAAVDKATK